MSSHRQPSAFAAGLSNAAGVRPAIGLTFATPEVLDALGGSPEPAVALPAAAQRVGLDFVFVPSSALSACEAIERAGCTPIAEIAGPLGGTLRDVGWPEGLRAIAFDPASLRGALDEGVRHAVDMVGAAADAGAGGVVVAEDLAGSTGPLVSPDFALGEVFGRLARIVDAARDRRLPAVLHTDGDARAFLGGAARAGFVALHGGGGLDEDRLAEYVSAVRSAGLAFIGCLRTEELLRGPMRAIAAGSKAGVAARAGGVLLADDGGMTTRVEAAAFVTALEAARDAAGRGCHGSD